MDRIAKFLILLVAALVLVPGCFAEEQKTDAVATPTIEEVITVAGNETAEKVVPDFTANETVTSLNMSVNQTVAIALTAEEAEGIWNITNTDGLEQVGSSTVTNGTEEWIIKAITAGNQTFSAVHEAVNATAPEAGETYNLEIVVE